MNRREDLQQFFISANTAQDRLGFDLEKFTDEYLKRNPDEIQNVCFICENLKQNKMDDYLKFLESKQKKITKSGFEVDEKDLNKNLFKFQKFVVKRALLTGKFAIFADTGMGKTIMQLEWAKHVSVKTGKPVLIFAPLAVSEQTIEEGVKFGIEIERYFKDSDSSIQITNYEQFDNVDLSKFSGLVLDESSILKNEIGKYRNRLINGCKNIHYRLACTATPSPNDPMELGNHAEFLDVMSYNEMLAMYFVHDAQQTQKWRLKGHAVGKFYEFVATWSVMFNKPSNLGFDDKGYDLPELTIKEKQVSTPIPDGFLFGGTAVSATDFNKSLRETQKERINKTIEIVKTLGNEQIIIWTKQNDEANVIYKQLAGLGYDCKNVQGSDSPDKKSRDLIDFAHFEYQILISKLKIASFGMNFQNCHNQIFNSVDFSFESTYQGMRRSWRFGQENKVNIWLITTDRMINVLKTIQDKEHKFKIMQQEMTSAVNKNLHGKITETGNKSNDIKTDDYWLMQGDCVQRIKEVDDNLVDLIMFSPPFADLYTYSNFIEDMGNVADYDEFVKQFTFLVKELKRVIRPGRIIAVHSMNLPTLKSMDGYIGIKRFNALIGDLFEAEDMFLHSEFTIWKDPLLAAVRTKTIGLAHKQLMKDSSIIRAGIPDVVQCFKTKEENEVPIEHDLLDSYVPMHEFDKFPTSEKGFNEYWGYDPESKYSRLEQYSHHVWQRYASPIWMDIQQTDVLKYTTARDENDEKHICPLQLPVIKRILTLYSKEGETILSPFGGIGSEGYQAIKMSRKSISIELKPSYFEINKRNHHSAIEQNGQLTWI
jgi:superfamily II DNA or RNA helicase